MTGEYIIICFGRTNATANLSQKILFGMLPKHEAEHKSLVAEPSLLPYNFATRNAAKALRHDGAVTLPHGEVNINFGAGVVSLSILHSLIHARIGSICKISSDIQCSCILFRVPDAGTGQPPPPSTTTGFQPHAQLQLIKR